MDFLTKYTTVIKDEIESIQLPKQPKNLYDPISYFLSLGGKRLRPILALMACRLFNQDIKKAIPIANMVELFHNFSLIHDDIMDAAPLRRGKQTVHEKWNSNIGILSGDMVLIKAYQELEKVDDNYQSEILKIFNFCAVKVCEGQQFDMDFENRDDVTVEEYINMIYLKTSTLLEHTLEMGGVVAGIDISQRQKLREFGKNVGIAFQLRDDLLDVFGEGDFGKQKAGDIISNKKTFLLLKAFEKANPKQKEVIQSWVSKSEFDEKEKVESVTSIFRELEIESETSGQINHYNTLASNALAELNDVNTEVKSELKGLQNYLMNRTV